MTDDCQHGYERLLNIEDKSMYFTKYISFFCPDCGVRIPENP